MSDLAPGPAALIRRSAEHTVNVARRRLEAAQAEMTSAETFLANAQAAEVEANHRHAPRSSAR